MTNPTIYIGTPSALQAEIGLLPCYTGKYIVAAFDADGREYTPEIADSIDDAHAFAGEFSAMFKSRGENARISFIA